MLLLGAGLALAGSAGYLTSQALGVGSQQPTSTVTISIPTGTGQQGPAGPAGPAGPKGDPGTPGAESCPAGYTFSALVIIVQGQGPTQIATCLKS
jgi:hypothetical protein